MSTQVSGRAGDRADQIDTAALEQSLRSREWAPRTPQDCPVNVDMATYKAEFLAHHDAGRLRPRADYAMRYLPTAAHAVSRLGVAGLVNRLARTPAERYRAP